MKIVLLGAGASIKAGYPLAKQLMFTIQREAMGSNFLNLKTAWDAWAEFVKGQTGVLALLMNDPNPEIVLSALDLCATTNEAEGLGCIRKEHADEAFSRVMSDGQIPCDWFKSKDHEDLWRAKEARKGFIECLLWFFRFKHHEDALPETRKRRDYLRDLLAKLDDGDIVVTLNWDTTVERTLAEEGRWNPLTGYGFEKDLQTGWPDALEELPAGLSKKSEIIVLKLHGSLGWHNSHGMIYFSNEYFLSEFDFCFNGVSLPLLDPAIPSCDPDYSPVLAYPSFLKQLPGPQMQQVWHLATEAFGQAQEINIWGYSLPESDVAMRTLLNPLRFRLDEHQVQVFVHEPYDGEVRSRWREFLGDEVRIDRLGLGLSELQRPEDSPTAWHESDAITGKVRMTCDICGPGDKKEVRQPAAVSQRPLVLCHRLECGHQWHTQYPATGDPNQHRECDCTDYSRSST